MSTTESPKGKYGLWLVIRPHHKPESRSTYSWCRCLGCDGEKPVMDYDLIAGRSTACHPCSKRLKPQLETHARVMGEIATAKAAAIDSGSNAMPYRKVILKRAGANLTYFCNQNQYSIAARQAYEAAAAELQAKPNLKPPKPMRKQLAVKSNVAVLRAIAAAKATSIADLSFKLPSLNAMCELANVCYSYFRQVNPSSVEALAVYEAAKAELKALQLEADALSQPLALVPSLLTPHSSQSKTSKEAQLLAHLRLQPKYVKSLPILLGITAEAAKKIVKRLEHRGLIEVLSYPVSYKDQGQNDRIALKQSKNQKQSA